MTKVHLQAIIAQLLNSATKRAIYATLVSEKAAVNVSISGSDASPETTSPLTKTNGSPIAVTA